MLAIKEKTLDEQILSYYDGTIEALVDRGYSQLDAKKILEKIEFLSVLSSHHEYYFHYLPESIIDDILEASSKNLS